MGQLEGYIYIWYRLLKIVKIKTNELMPEGKNERNLNHMQWQIGEIILFQSDSCDLRSSINKLWGNVLTI